MSLNESSEMYLETIYILEKEHGHAHVVDIARNLGVTKPSVSKAMGQLEKEDLITKESYQPITLTKKGREIAGQIYNKHRLIARYLEQSLGLSPYESAENACRMEHVISESMFRAIEEYFEAK